tara:strand:- start:103 stop:576 length:474 start_codon:yes stop_codon:yes gene_type:complete
MEHLKNIMEKLDLMNEEEKFNNEEYRFLMKEIKSAYDLQNVGKFVKVMEVKPKVNIYWKTKYNSGFHTHTEWAHNTDSCEDEECECGNCEGNQPLEQTELSVGLKDTIHLLKIVYNDDFPLINTKENTITNERYEKLKENKVDKWGDKMFVFIGDVE